MVSIHDIAFYFVETIINKNLSTINATTLYENTVKALTYLLNNNMTSEQLLKEIPHINKQIDAGTDIKSLFKRADQTKENLLVQGHFYYHNLVRSLPKPPQTSWDINTGEIVTTNEPYFLEMRASITLEQVVDYYCSRFNIKLDATATNRYKGSFRYMIQKLGIDLVLFMIDTASDIIMSEDMPKPTSPVGIGEYEATARQCYFAKVSENIASGDDQIVFKSRVLPCRNRREETEQELSEEYFNYA